MAIYTICRWPRIRLFVVTYFTLKFVVPICCFKDAGPVETRVVELGVICDMEFSQRLLFEETHITEFIQALVQDTEVTFRTLHKTKLAFRMTALQIISDKRNQHFVENSRFSDFTTNLTSMYIEFGKWVYHTDIANQSDIVMLITGSMGTYGWISLKENACLQPDNIIFRLTSSPFVWQNKISQAIARSLGADFTRKTNCTVRAWHMDSSKFKSPDFYYFSECSDQAIYDFVKSNSSWCLQTSNADKIYTNTSSMKITSLSVEHQCKAKYSNCTNADIESCEIIRCYQDTTLLGPVHPIYNTICGENKVCFRGLCLPAGIILTNLGTNKCLYASKSTLFMQNIQLTQCKSGAFRFDKVMFNRTIDGGVLIVATNDHVNNPEKCLTVDDASLAVMFDKCPTKTSPIFMWDLLKIDQNKNSFYLCHRNSLMCAASSTGGLVYLHTGPNRNDTLKHWTLMESPNGSIDKYIQTSQKLMELYLPTKITVRLLVLCDDEFGLKFSGVDAIQNYWKFMIDDAYSKFQLIENLDVRFLVTEKLFFMDPTHSQNKTNFSQTSLVTTIEDVNQAFTKWLEKHTNSLPNFDIAILTTGKRLQGKVASTQVKMNCGSNDTENRFLGTVTLQVAKYSDDPCANLAEAFRNIFGFTSNFSNFDLKACTNQSCSVNSNGHSYISACDEVRMKLYFQENRNCFLNTQTIVKSRLRFDYKKNYPTTFEQCNSFSGENVKDTKQDTENCVTTNCYFTGIYTKKLFLAGRIFPIYKTPCGTNKYCFQGNCINKGFQLQHVESHKCIVGNNFMQANKVELVPCLESSFLTEELTISNVATNGFELSTFGISKGQVSNSSTCLSLSKPDNVLKYQLCSSPTQDYQLWEFLRAHNHFFMIYHHGSQKCLGADSNTSFVFTSLCDSEDRNIMWKYFEN